MSIKGIITMVMEFPKTAFHIVAKWIYLATSFIPEWVKAIFFLFLMLIAVILAIWLWKNRNSWQHVRY